MRDAIYYTALYICIPVEKSVFLIMSKQIMFWVHGEAGWGWGLGGWGSSGSTSSTSFSHREINNTVIKRRMKEGEERGH